MKNLIVGILLIVGASIAEASAVYCPSLVTCKWEDPYDPSTAKCSLNQMGSIWRLGSKGNSEGKYKFDHVEIASNGRATCLYQGDEGSEVTAISDIALIADPDGFNYWADMGYMRCGDSPSTCLMLTAHK